MAPLTSTLLVWQLVKARSAVGKDMVCKHQQPQNGPPHILLSILLAQQQVAKW